MTRLATLRDPDQYEPTFEDFHLAGTGYDSPEAPNFTESLPCNRCDVWRCAQCDRLLLRYTEFGGYYVHHRVRALRSELIAD